MFHARQPDQIAPAVERGWMEQAAKNKLKDLLLKELEAQIHEWQAAGIKHLQSSTTPVMPTTTTSAGPVAPTHQSQATKAAQLGANRTAATPTSHTLSLLWLPRLQLVRLLSPKASIRS